MLSIPQAYPGLTRTLVAVENLVPSVCSKITDMGMSSFDVAEQALMVCATIMLITGVFFTHLLQLNCNVHRRCIRWSTTCRPGRTSSYRADCAPCWPTLDSTQVNSKKDSKATHELARLLFAHPPRKKHDILVSICICSWSAKDISIDCCAVGKLNLFIIFRS